MPAEGWRYFFGDLFEHFEDALEGWVDGVELEDEVGGVGEDAVGGQAGGDVFGCTVGDVGALAVGFGERPAGMPPMACFSI